MSGNALQNENPQEGAPKVFLLTPGEIVAHALDEAEQTLDMLHRGLTYAAEKSIRIVNWSARELCENKVDCEVARGKKASVSVITGHTLFDERNILETCIAYGRGSVAVPDPDRFVRCLSGFAHIAADHLQEEEVDLHFPFTDPASDRPEIRRRPFEVYLRNDSHPVDYDELPEDLVEFLGSPKLPNMLVCGVPAGAWNPTVSIQPLRGTSRKSDPLEVMSKLKLAHDAMARGPEKFDPS